MAHPIRIILTVLLFSASTTAAEGPSRLTIQGLPKYIKGFPVLLRLQAKGPLMMPACTLFSTNAELSVLLRSPDGEGKEYVLTGFNPGVTEEWHVLVGNGDSATIDSLEIYRDRVPEGSTVARMLDVASLRSLDLNEAGLDNIPPGKYQLRVVLPDGTRSNNIGIELLQPSSSEQQFADRVLAAVPGNTRFCWSNIFQVCYSLDGNQKQERLTDTAMEQFSFHLRVCKVLNHDDSPDRALRDEVEKIKIPDVFETEGRCILAELDALTKGGTSDEATALKATHPEVKWRLDAIGRQEFEFLAGREFARTIRRSQGEKR